MAIARAALLLIAVVALALVLVSGGSDAGPRTPPALPGLPPPFLGTAVSGDGGLTAAIDAYGNVVDLRARPAGPALIENPAARQAAGTVPAATGIVPRVRVGDGASLPLWRAEWVRQRHLPGTNVVETVALVRGARVRVRAAAAGEALALEVVAWGRRGGRGANGGVAAVPAVSVNVEDGVECVWVRGSRTPGGDGVGQGARGRRAAVLDLLCAVGQALPPAVRAEAEGRGTVVGRRDEWVAREGRRVMREAVVGARRWLRRAGRLGDGAPGWARGMYERSLLVLRALTDRRTGAVAAGARDGWAYVWPRDAATVALAYAASGHRGEAGRVAGFLRRLLAGDDGVARAARFHGDGTPVPGRGPQGDAIGWIAVAQRAGRDGGDGASAGRGGVADFLGAMATAGSNALELPDYQEGEAGRYLGNAIAAGVPAARIAAEFGTPRGLVREADDPSSGLDSAAAWAVRPFPRPRLYPAVRRTLLNLAAAATPHGITPGEGWGGGADPWTAPTAWSAWSLAALGERRAALGLLAALRRAATPAGALPERVDARGGVPRSTTPLPWSHAFAILALRELWPGPDR